jgi:hypothetical protein
MEVYLKCCLVFLGIAAVARASCPAHARPQQRADLPAHRGDRQLPGQRHVLDLRLAADSLEQLPT